MLRNPVPRRGGAWTGYRQVEERCLLTFCLSGCVRLVALCRWSHSDTVSFHLNDLFAASHAVIDSTGDFTCDSPLEMQIYLRF